MLVCCKNQFTLISNGRHFKFTLILFLKCEMTKEKSSSITFQVSFTSFSSKFLYFKQTENERMMTSLVFSPSSPFSSSPFSSSPFLLILLFFLFAMKLKLSDTATDEHSMKVHSQSPLLKRVDPPFIHNCPLKLSNFIVAHPIVDVSLGKLSDLSPFGSLMKIAQLVEGNQP